LENEANLEEDCLVEIYTALSKIINGKHINICLLDKLSRDSFRKFIKLIIITMCKVIETIESSAELAQALLALTLLITDNVIKQLFNMEEADLGQGINYLVNQLMKKLRISFEVIAAGLFE
jgi:hypothetical protein